MSRDRVLWADLLDLYGDESESDPQTVLTDALTDLRHLALRMGLNYERADLTARIHFDEETS